MSSAAQASGESAESRALAALQRSGLTLIERNFHCRHGELDLILADGEILVVVEVRYRRSRGHGGAAVSIDRRKRARLVAATRQFLQRRPRLRDRPVRFDVVAIDAGRLRWIKAAFDTDR